MIQFDFDWSAPMNQVILVLAIALLFMQLWLLVIKNRPAFTGRLAVRLGLNFLLWIAVMAFILQPYFKKNSASANGIIIGKDVSSEFASRLKDSLITAEVLSLDLESFQNFPSLLSNIDTLFLAGQNFESVLFQTLTQTEQHPAIKWISYSGNDQVNDLNWKAILKNGEMQSINGSVESSKKQVLKLRYGNQTLDSTQLNIGTNSFKLSFPVFTQGRTLTELNLDNKTVDTIRFFARRIEPLTFQFILDNPDFESRSLATWLGKNGHSVLYNTTLSKDLKSKLTINKAKDPDVIITDPGNASNAIVKKAVANGKSILFINSTNPSSEIVTVNTALGTKFQVRKISNETAVTLSPELTALPYNFIASNHYLLLTGYPGAVQKTAGKIGFSLLNETFPLMLNGDSITYQKIWNTILASIHPATSSNLNVQAPIYKDLKTEIVLNNFPVAKKLLDIGNDSLFLDYSAVNNRSAIGSFMPGKTGWTSSPDSLGIELFVENGAVYKADYSFKKVKDFVHSYSSFQAELNEEMIRPNSVLDKGIKKRLSDWIWFGIVIVCLACVWVEGKL